MAGSELDLNNPNTLPFVKSIFDEYIDGEDPVFLNKMVHFGADEYTGGIHHHLSKSDKI